MRRVALGALAVAAFIVALAACKDGVTPDCTTDPSVCDPIVGGLGDAATDAGQATDAHVADAADAG